MIQYIDTFKHDTKAVEFLNNLFSLQLANSSFINVDSLLDTTVNFDGYSVRDNFTEIVETAEQLDIKYFGQDFALFGALLNSVRNYTPYNVEDIVKDLDFCEESIF